MVLKMIMIFLIGYLFLKFYCYQSSFLVSFFSFYCAVCRLPLTSGGLAKAGGSLPVLRDTNFHFRTTFSAELHPRLRQTAR
jgi:hypothetical protein